MIKLCIAGSRGITSYKALVDEINKALPAIGTVSEVVSGGAKGVDHLGELWAERSNIPIVLFEANWDKFGELAGMKRNAEMAQYADAAVILWDGESTGTANFIKCMRAHDKKIFLKIMKIKKEKKK